MQDRSPLSRRTLIGLGLTSLAVPILSGCGGSDDASPTSGITPSGAASSANLKGIINIDGSSTVFPITEAVAEEFQKANPGVKVTVGISGTGGGFKKFGRGETDLSNASRPIKGEEADAAKTTGIDFVEIPVAFDALSVVVNPKNTWCTSLTAAELKKIWEPAAQGKIMKWSQVRAGFPDQPLKLYGAGSDSGTFDYFTDAINGKEGEIRGDYTPSEDDNVLVQGVSRDVNALGFFGLAYLLENEGKIKPVPIDDEKADNGDGPEMPTVDNVMAGTYQPLARPIFIYVSTKAAGRPEVDAFVRFYLEHANELVKEVGYVPLGDTVIELATKRYDSKTPGSVFKGGSQVGVKLEEILK